MMMMTTLTTTMSSSSRTTRLLKLRSAKKKKTSSSSFFKQPRVLVLSSSRAEEETNNNDRAQHLNLPREAAVASSLAAAMMTIVFASSFSTTAFAASTTTRFAGSFADPNHPGCPREITPSGLLRGYDPVPFEKGRGCRGRKIVTPDDVFDYPGKTMRYWELKTKINKSDDEIFIDFDAKDGSGEKVTAKLNAKKGEIEFPTGEVWKRRRGESFFP
jgi:hypothetical protein